MSRYVLDLGTAETRLGVGSEPILAVPSLAAVHADSGRVLAIGEEARAEALRTGARATLAHVIDAGTPSDPRVLEAFLGRLLRAAGVRGFGHGRVELALGLAATSVERTTLARVLRRLGASDVHVTPPTLAAAASAGADADVGTLVVVVGEGYTEAAIVALGSVCASAAAKVGVRDLRHSVREYLWGTHELAVGDTVAAEVLEKLTNLASPNPQARARIWGRRRSDADSASAVVDAAELVAQMEPTLSTIEQLARAAIHEAHAELVADVASRGFVLAGGGAAVPGLAERLATALTIPAEVVAEPALAVVRGLRAPAPQAQRA